MGMFKQEKDEALIAQGYALGIEHAKQAVTTGAMRAPPSAKDYILDVGKAIQERAEQQEDKWYPG